MLLALRREDRPVGDVGDTHQTLLNTVLTGVGHVAALRGQLLDKLLVVGELFVDVVPSFVGVRVREAPPCIALRLIGQLFLFFKQVPRPLGARVCHYFQPARLER